MDRHTRRVHGRRESGSALVVAVLLLIVVSALAMSSMQTVASDQQVAGFQKQEHLAFYAAEAGAVAAREVVRGMGGRSEKPTYPADYPNAASPQLIGEAADFPNSPQPRFYADPAVVPAIGYVGEGAMCTEGCNITLGGVKYNHTRWKANVVGESPSGDTRRVELVATRLLAVGY